MYRTLLFAIAALTVPELALGCGGGDERFEIMLFLMVATLMLPAFLIPAAGILSLPTRPRFPLWYYYFAFVVFSLSAPFFTMVLRSPDEVTLALLPLCLLGLVAPSIQYMWLAIKASRQSDTEHKST